jgi:hypothetical protein
MDRWPGGSLLGTLPALSREALLRLGAATVYKAGRRIIAEDDDSTFVVLITGGCVKITGRLDDGREALLRAIEPWTSVRLDKPVLSSQQEAWTKRQAAVNEHELASLLAGQLSERRETWHAFLKTAESEWHSPYAVALSQDPGAAGDIVQKMFDDRLEQVKEMTRELISQVEEYGKRDTFELMTQNETVLRRLMALLKIPDPSDPPSATFDAGQPGAANGSGPG